MEFNQIRNNAETYGIPIIRTESHTLLEEIVRTTNPKHILEIAKPNDRIVLMGARDNSITDMGFELLEKL